MNWGAFWFCVCFLAVNMLFAFFVWTQRVQVRIWSGTVTKFDRFIARIVGIDV